MNKIKITKEMLEGEGSRVLATGVTTDEEINVYGWGKRQDELKFVVSKGFIDDWCIYVESMEDFQSFEEVLSVGNKISPETAKKLIICDEGVLARYRL